MSAAGLLAAFGLLVAPMFEDESVRFEMPEGWTASGEAGEYWMESGPDVASLLLLPPDPDRPIEVILADIEEQFLSTGAIEPESSGTLNVDGNVVHVRRYRLEVAGSGADAILMHQYVFVRSAIHVLLQVETPPKGSDPEPLFREIHRTLEIRLAPDPFDAGIDPFSEAEEAPEEVEEQAPVDSAGPPGG
jgi:hypothetical protein